MAGTLVFRPTSLPRWCDVLLVLTFVTAVVVLFLGWIGGIDLAVRLWPGYAAMVPSTAILFMLFSLALLVHIRTPVPSIVLRGVALFGIALATVNLLLVALGISNGIDSLLWPRTDYFIEDRMAVGTSFGFLLLGISFFCLPTPAARHPLFVTATTIGWAFAMIALIGYLFDAEELYEVSIFTAMALHTAICLVTLFTASLFARPERGWVRTLMGRGEGSRGARRIMPFVLLVPLVLCFLVLIGTRLGWYGPDFRLSILAILIMTLLAAAVLRNAAIENRTHRKLVATVKRLEQASADQQVLLSEVYHRVRNNLQQVASLIELQKPFTPENGREALDLVGMRVGALADVHAVLVERDTPSSINLTHFLEGVCKSLVHRHHGREGSEQCRVHVEPRKVSIDFAINLGLLVNEVIWKSISNSDANSALQKILISSKNTPEGNLLIEISNKNGQFSLSALKTRDLDSRILDGLLRTIGGILSVSDPEGDSVSVTIPASSIS